MTGSADVPQRAAKPNKFQRLYSRRLKAAEREIDGKRQSNTTLDAGGDSGYWLRAAQAAGVSSASRWMEMSARPGNTAPR